MGLRLAGLPQATIDEIEKAAPATADLIKILRDNDQLIRKIGALYAEAKPLIDQAIPIVQKAYAELQTILPAAQDVAAFISAQQKPPSVPAPGSEF